MLAVLALMLLLSIGYAAKGIANLMPGANIPIIGSIRGWIIRLADAWIDTIGHVFDAVVSPLADVIEAPIQVVANIIDRIYKYLNDLQTVAKWTVVTFIPRELSAVRKWAAAELAVSATSLSHIIDSGVSTLYKDFLAAKAYALAKVEALAKTVAADLTKAENFTKSEIATALAAGTAVLTKAETFTTAAVATLGRAVVTEVAQSAGIAAAATVALSKTVATDVAGLGARIDQVATTTVAATLGVLSTDIDHVATAAWVELEDAVGAAIGVAGTDFPDIRSWLGDLSIPKIGDIAGVTTIAISVAGALSRYLEECGMPNCRNLSALGRDLQALLGLVEDAAFLAFLIEFAANPSGAANDVESFLGPVASGIKDTLSSAFGVG